MDERETRFWDAAAEVMRAPGVARSTMMGFPCLRVDAKFFATFDRGSGGLVVKLPKDRVDRLIADGSGQPFAPAGRRFREWVAIPVAAERDWPAYLSEALGFAAQAA